MTESQLRLATAWLAALMHHGYVPVTQAPRSIDFVFLEDVP